MLINTFYYILQIALDVYLAIYTEDVFLFITGIYLIRSGSRLCIIPDFSEDRLKLSHLTHDLIMSFPCNIQMSGNTLIDQFKCSCLRTDHIFQCIHLLSVLLYRQTNRSLCIGVVICDNAAGTGRNGIGQCCCPAICIIFLNRCDLDVSF